MLSSKLKSIVASTGILLASFAGTVDVFADFSDMDSVMTISPPTQRILLTPGEDFEGSIIISGSGNSKNDLSYSVTIGSYGLTKDENGNADYDDIDTDTVTAYNQIMDWIELKKDKGSVPRGESDSIPFVIHVPRDAPAGGQYASIIIQDDTKADNQNSGGIQIENKIRFAADLLAEVAGKTVEKGEITENNIPSFLLNNQLTATSWVKNDGNIHTDAQYTLQVWPLFSDEEICTNEEKNETSLIMPDTERYHAQTCSLPSIGIFKAKQVVKIFGETSIVERTIVFCPLWLLFMLLFILIAIVVWIIFKVRGNKKRKSTRGEE